MQLRVYTDNLKNEPRIEVLVEDNDTYDDMEYFWFYFIEEALHRIKSSKRYV